MKLFLRCKCGRALGLPRTERAPGCKDKWCFQFKDGGVIHPTTRGTTPFTNKTDAQRFADKCKANYFKRKHGLPLDEDEQTTRRPETVRLADLAATFKDWLPGALPKSFRNYLPVVDSFVGFLGGDTLIHAIVPFDLERWKTFRSQQPAINGKASTIANPTIRTPRIVSRQTVNTNLAQLRTLFRMAEVWHPGFKSPFALVVDPTDGTRKSPVGEYVIGKGERKRIVPLSPEEVAWVCARLPVPYGLLCETTYQILPRISEVVALHKRQVGIVTRADGTRHGWFQRDLKGGDEARVGIPLAVAEALVARGDSLPRGETRLFYDVAKNPSAKLRDLFDRLGKPYSHHWFRHSGVTSMKDAGNVNHAAIVVLAGWKNDDQIETYGHVSDAAVARAGNTNADLLARAKAAHRSPLAAAEARLAAAVAAVAEARRAVEDLRAVAGKKRRGAA